MHTPHRDERSPLRRQRAFPTSVPRQRSLTAVLFASLLAAGPALAAETAAAAADAPTAAAADAPAAAGGPRMRRGQGAMGDPAQRADMRERMAERMADMLRQRLEATDEEWAVIRPRIERVTALRMPPGGPMALAAGRMGGGFGGGAGPGDAAPGAGGPRGGFAGGPGAGGLGGMFGGGPPQPEDQPVIDAQRVLAEALRDGADAKQLKSALRAVREARAEREEVTEEARDALREVLSQRQEATLVLMGVLD
jgi:hypothetical protein